MRFPEYMWFNQHGLPVDAYGRPRDMFYMGPVDLEGQPVERTKQRHTRGCRWANCPEAQREALMREWAEDPGLKLVAVVERCDMSSGFPLWSTHWVYSKEKRELTGAVPERTVAMEIFLNGLAVLVAVGLIIALGVFLASSGWSLRELVLY